MTSVGVGIHVLHRTSCLQLAISIFAVIHAAPVFGHQKHQNYFFQNFSYLKEVSPLGKEERKRKAVKVVPYQNSPDCKPLLS